MFQQNFFCKNAVILLQQALNLCFFKFRWSTRNMKKSIWPDLNSQVFKLTSLHPREENHPEMVNIARVFTFRSSHQHHCHSFRFSFEFAFFSLVSSTSSTSLAIWTPTWKPKKKLYKLLHFQWKTIQLLTVSRSFRKGLWTSNQQHRPLHLWRIWLHLRTKSHPHMPNMLGDSKKERITASWRLLSHSPYVVGWTIAVFFGKQLSENHRLLVFSMDVSCWKSQDLQKTAKLGEKSTRKIKMWGQWLVFVLGPWRQSVLSSKVTTYPTSPAKNLAARKHSNTVGSCCSTMLPCLQPAEVRSWRYSCFPSQLKLLLVESIHVSPRFSWHKTKQNTRFQKFLLMEDHCKVGPYQL